MKTLRPVAFALACLALSSCTTIRPGNHLTLQEGQTGKIGFKTVTLKKVLDSRCPLDVDCVWAGDVVTEVRVVQGLRGQDVSVLTLRFPHDTEEEWKGLRIENVTRTQPLKVTFTDKQP